MNKPINIQPFICEVNKCPDIQRLKAENEQLKQYKQSKQASYETMQTEWNKAINENRLLKAENERLSELTCVNCGEKFLSPTGSELYEKIVQLKAENELFKNAHKTEQDRRRNYEQVLEDVHNLLSKSMDINLKSADKHFSFIDEAIDKINEVLKDD